MKYDIKRLKKDIKTDGIGPSATVDCSIMAHVRGKLHMKKLHASTLVELGYAPAGFWGPGEKQVVEWDMEDQEGLVEKYLVDYEVVENTVLSEQVMTNLQLVERGDVLI
jgi:hypothetical protein